MSESGQPNTVIAAGSYLRGDMSISGAAQIVGTFEGSVQGEGDLHIDEAGTCKGNIHVASVVVDGSVEGNITASDRIQLNPKANVVGDIAAKKIAISDGATFTGNCAIGAQAKPPIHDSGSSSSAAPAAQPSAPAARPAPRKTDSADPLGLDAISGPSADDDE